MSRESRIQRAWRDTSFSWIRELFVFAIAGFLAWIFLPEDQAMQKVKILLIAAAAAVLFWCFEFVWNWIRAPMRMAREEIAALKADNISLRNTAEKYRASRGLSWAPLTAAQERDIVNALAGVKKYRLFISCNGSDCFELAKSFQRIFDELQWPVVCGSGGQDAEGADGLVIIPNDDPATVLKEAIEKMTDINVQILNISRERAGYRDYDTMLIIGTKPWHAENT